MVDQPPRYRSRWQSKAPPRPKANDFTGWQRERTLSTPLPANVLLPVAYDDRDLAAVQAVRDGRASQEQQRRALEWIVWASGAYGRTFRPDPYEAAYAAGRRELGVELVKLLNTKASRASTTEQG
jgi:hypothetical protein